MLTLRNYRRISRYIHPLVYAWLLKRAHSGKENKERLPERLGHSAVTRPDKDIIWIHAASVGESISVLPFIKQLCDNFPTVFVVITTGTVSSADMLASRLPKRAVHQFAPVDTIIAAERFLSHWRPGAAFFTESELWPCLAEQTSTRCPLILLNARMSEKSAANWRKRPAFAREIMQCFAAIYPQEQRYVDVFKAFGAANVRYIGNLKYDAPPLPDDPAETGKLLDCIGDRPLWVAASMHEGEEHVIMAAHLTLKDIYPDLLTIIAPRHTRNGKLFEKAATDKHCTTAVRSRDELPDDETDVYIADTMGEMGVFFRISSIVFVGGSFVEVGGHNPLEPARLNCAIFFGPYIENFTVITEEILREKAAVQVHDTEAFITCLTALFEDGNESERMSANAKKLAQQKSSIISDHIEACLPYLPDASDEDVTTA